jgi:hypothetical protein
MKRVVVMFTRVTLSGLFAAGIAAAQFIGSTPIGASRSAGTTGADSRSPSGSALIFGPGSTTFPGPAAPNYTIPVRPLPPDRGYGFPYLTPRNYIPLHSYNDFVRRTPSQEIAPSLLPPKTPQTKAWDAIRSDYALAVVRVSASRQFVDELRARQEEMGLTTDANLLTNTLNAEAALKSARDAMAAQDLEASRTAIRQANGLALVILKEFGH